MVDRPESFEVDDGLGQTVFYSFTALFFSGQTVTAPAGTEFREIWWGPQYAAPISDYMEVSLDGGTTWMRRYGKQPITWTTIRGTVTSILVRSSNALLFGVDCQMIANYEPI